MTINRNINKFILFKFIISGYCLYCHFWYSWLSQIFKYFIIIFLIKYIIISMEWLVFICLLIQLYRFLSLLILIQFFKFLIECPETLFRLFDLIIFVFQVNPFLVWFKYIILFLYLFLILNIYIQVIDLFYIHVWFKYFVFFYLFEIIF